MAFIKTALDAKESEIAPEGEYDLRIVKVEEKKTGDKSKIPGEPMIQCTIRIEEPNSNYSLFNHTLMIVTKKTPDENKDMYKLNIQRFLETFNIPHEDTGFDTDDLQGAEGRCMVTQKDGDDGVTRNQLRLPRLKGE